MSKEDVKIDVEVDGRKFKQVITKKPDATPKAWKFVLKGGEGLGEHHIQGEPQKSHFDKYAKGLPVDKSQKTDIEKELKPHLAGLVFSIETKTMAAIPQIPVTSEDIHKTNEEVAKDVLKRIKFSKF